MRNWSCTIKSTTSTTWNEIRIGDRNATNNIRCRRIFLFKMTFTSLSSFVSALWHLKHVEPTRYKKIFKKNLSDHRAKTNYLRLTALHCINTRTCNKKMSLSKLKSDITKGTWKINEIKKCILCNKIRKTLERTFLT